MLNRKIESELRTYFRSNESKMLIVDGARQIGKSYIIRHVGQEMFPNYIEINLEKDKLGDKLFQDISTINDFYLTLSTIAGDKMKEKENTLVFIDEIQAYPQYLTMIKFLMEDGRFTYVGSGSLLGVALKKTSSVPLGSMRTVHMYPLDFEEFLTANGVGQMVIDDMRRRFESDDSLPASIHNKIMDYFRKYLLVGGLPDSVNIFLAENNIMNIRKSQAEIVDLYKIDAAKYEKDSNKKLKIQRIYEMLPSNMENKKKRIVAQNIEGKKGRRMSNYQDEFDYLISSGISLDVKAISQPSYPLVQNAGKNLLKLYLNDVGLFTGILYHNNIKPVMDDSKSVNLGSVYETVAAQELKAHGFSLYYYDNKQNGEVDYLIDDYSHLTVLPLEIKSGKDYMVHSALDKLLSIDNYQIKQAYVLSNEREVSVKDGITYIPIYYIMFFRPEEEATSFDSL